jgi:hypothetical protein
MKLNLLLLSAAALFNAATADNEPTVNLRSAGSYVILAKTGISTVPDSSITGDIAVSPIAATAITGFGLTLKAGEDWSTAPQFAGYKAFAPDYSGPVATLLTTAVGDMETAYADASQRSSTDPTRSNLGGGDISGLTLSPGVYTFTKAISINSDITLSGSANDIFIIKTTDSLLQADGTQVILSGGALAQNIFWQVAGKVEVGSGSILKGIILVKQDALFKTGSSLTGRVFAQTACNLQVASITEA